MAAVPFRWPAESYIRDLEICSDLKIVYHGILIYLYLSTGVFIIQQLAIALIIMKDHGARLIDDLIPHNGI